jgi:hypothetical protein
MMDRSLGDFNATKNEQKGVLISFWAIFCVGGKMS